ncbi:MAG: WecB/TagA/CpsF family glycosyltransferase [Chloroflexi bacterium]|nr:WecB/TagA/CpsF family glycosyltransferase [Chloroflexota bacterium]
MRKLLIILGVPIDDLSMAEALDRIEQFIMVGRSTGKSHQIATVNADFVIKAHADPELRQILQETDMATADGMPLVWGARALGVPLAGRVTGADLVPALAARAAQNGYSLYFLGGAPGVALRAAARLQELNAGLRIAGVSSPAIPSLFEPDPALLDTIRAAHPDILLVALGNPKQEKWINMHASELSIPIMIGVGGTLDFIAGTTRRAPEWMQHAGLEWLFRLIQEPRRLWKRYVVDLAGFGLFFVRQWWVMRRSGPVAPVLPVADALIVEDTAIIHISGRLDAHSAPAFTLKAQEVLANISMVANTSKIIVNLSKAEFLDSTGVGALVSLTKQARDAGGDVVLAAVPPPIIKVLSLLRLTQFFEIHEDTDSAFRASRSHAQTPADAERVQVVSGWTILAMPRRLDVSTTPQVTDTGLQTLELSPRLVLDFSNTTFMSSAGLAFIMRLSREAKNRGGEVRVAGCSGDVLRTIELTKFDKVVPLFADVKQATT